MKKVKKIKGVITFAYEIGSGSQVESNLIQSGKIRILPKGTYEIFSQESTNGSGEIAYIGDFFKVDSSGFPYPNKRNYFLENHKHISGDMYEQISKPLEAWTVNDDMSLEVQYLINYKGLVIDENHPDKYFIAPLWGTIESAARDAVIVFYEIKRDVDGNILDINFNFVERSEFNKTYKWL